MKIETLVREEGSHFSREKQAIRSCLLKLNFYNHITKSLAPGAVTYIAGFSI